MDTLKDQDKLTIELPQFVPVMHPDKFAETIGLSSGVVGGWIDADYIPTIKIGRYRMVNIAALVSTCRADLQPILER